MSPAQEFQLQRSAQYQPTESVLVYRLPQDSLRPDDFRTHRKWIPISSGAHGTTWFRQIASPEEYVLSAKKKTRVYHTLENWNCVYFFTPRTALRVYSTTREGSLHWTGNFTGPRVSICTATRREEHTWCSLQNSRRRRI